MLRIAKLVNHEAWIEISNGRAYLKWGHYPKTDGKIDPKLIRRASVIDSDGREHALAIGSDKDSTSKESLFLEFDAEKDGTIAVEYDRGIYSLTEDNKWVFGEKSYVASLGYAVKEARLICGFAKSYIAKRERTDAPIFEFDIVPEVVKKFEDGDKIGVNIFFRNKPTEAKLNLKNIRGHKAIEAENGYAEIELVRGLNLISAKYIDEKSKIAGVFDKRSITTTLTITVK